MRISSITLPCSLLLITTALAFLCPVGTAAEVDSFTEPYRRVEIPAAEIGIMDAFLVQEGDQVRQGQLLARMDDSVLLASLDVARAAKDAKGSLRAAEASVEAKQKQFDSYKSLRNRGNATQREMDRAENDLIQAKSQLQSVREELEVRRLEFERIKAQLEYRQIKSPINGFVVKIDSEVGQFVSPTKPVVMHVVQLDVLKAVFSVPLGAVGDLQPGQRVTVYVGAQKQKCPGVIEFVSPTANADSDSVPVKIRIPNFKGDIQSGASCVWDLKTEPPREEMSRQRTPRVR